MSDFIWSHVRSMTCAPATRDPYRTCYTLPKPLPPKKTLQRIRNVLAVAARRCYNVSGTSWKLLQEDVITFQEGLGNYCKKMSQRIRNTSVITSINSRRRYNISRTLESLETKKTQLGNQKMPTVPVTAAVIFIPLKLRPGFAGHFLRFDCTAFFLARFCSAPHTTYWSEGMAGCSSFVKFNIATVWSSNLEHFGC